MEDTKKAAFELIEKISPKKNKVFVVGLYGDLGTGKTTFMKGLAKSFGINETIQSPTFVIMKIYQTSPPSPLSFIRREGKENESSLGNKVFKHLIHIDAYRIEKSLELINLGWEEIIRDPKNLICVEWPERIADIMPEHIKIKFEHLEDENQRKITIE